MAGGIGRNGALTKEAKDFYAHMISAIDWYIYVLS